MNISTRHILTGTCDLPAGKILIIVADVPNNRMDTVDPQGNVKREFWTSYRIFKRERNADRYKDKIRKNYRNEELNKIMVEKRLFNFN